MRKLESKCPPSVLTMASGIRKQKKVKLPVAGMYEQCLFSFLKIADGRQSAASLFQAKVWITLTQHRN